METLLAAGLTNAATAAILAIAAAAIARFTRRPSLWYTLWLVVLLRLLAPPLLAIDLPVPELGQLGGDATLAGTVAVTGGPVAVANPESGWEPATIIMAIWFAGALVFLGFALAQSRHLSQILRSGEPPTEFVVHRVRELSFDLGLRRAPATIVVPDRVPPMLWAFLGAVRLILPAELLTRLNRSETDTLLAHELAHLSRRDHWVRHLELAALTLFWWNPVAWWATGRVRRAQELCCDRKVGELLPGHRRAYADTLVETARFLSGRRLPLGSPVRAMADLNQLKGRILMIMSSERRRNLSLPIRLTAASILLAALVITPVLTAEPDHQLAPGAPITLSLEKADLNDVLTTFSEITGFEVLAEPGISGTVTTELDGVPWDQALSKILQQQGLKWEFDGQQIIVRRPSGERLAPPAPPNGPAPPQVTGRLDGAEVFRYIEGGPITPPEVVSKVAPSYPEDARKNKIMGAVVAELLVDDTGVVRDVEIKKSPADDLAMAAIDALEQWRFAPATMDGEPVAVRYIVTVMFWLE